MLNENEERLQKVLARAGIASRRACEELIETGRVRVNGKIVTQLGIKVDPAKDKVSVDDQPVPIRASLAPAKIYLLLNKPVGYLSTVTDPHGRETIMDLIETDQRLYPVGRLDMDTEGLLILTNDGNFANSLMHPRYGLEKEYIALLDGITASHELELLRQGVPIPVENALGEHESYKTQPARVEIVRNEGSNTLVRFVIKEGKKRQIRLMAQAIHHPVLELTRVGYGPLRLGDLAAGRYRPLSKAEVKSLLDAANRAKLTTNDRQRVVSRHTAPQNPSHPLRHPSLAGRATKSGRTHSDSEKPEGTVKPKRPTRGRPASVEDNRDEHSFGRRTARPQFSSDGDAKTNRFGRSTNRQGGSRSGTATPAPKRSNSRNGRSSSIAKKGRRGADNR